MIDTRLRRTAGPERAVYSLRPTGTAHRRPDGVPRAPLPRTAGPECVVNTLRPAVLARHDLLAIGRAHPAQPCRSAPPPHRRRVAARRSQRVRLPESEDLLAFGYFAKRGHRFSSVLQPGAAHVPVTNLAHLSRTRARSGRYCARL